MEHIVKIKDLQKITHDVIRITFEKPDGYTFIPGQAADISVNQPNWEEKKSCFTFTSLPEEEDLEFTVKTYPSHQRVTNKLLAAQVGDEIILQDPFGDIRNQGEGIFIAGGAGITPFIAILKILEQKGEIGNSKLIFANKKAQDIIDAKYFTNLLGQNFINVLSDENIKGYENGYINSEIIEKYVSGNSDTFYLCGPPPMMNAVNEILIALGVNENKIIKESY